MRPSGCCRHACAWSRSHTVHRMSIASRQASTLWFVGRPDEPNNLLPWRRLCSILELALVMAGAGSPGGARKWRASTTGATIAEAHFTRISFCDHAASPSQDLPHHPRRQSPLDRGRRRAPVGCVDDRPRCSTCGHRHVDHQAATARAPCELSRQRPRRRLRPVLLLPAIDHVVRHPLREPPRPDLPRWSGADRPHAGRPSRRGRVGSTAQPAMGVHSLERGSEVRELPSQPRRPGSDRLGRRRIHRLSGLHREGGEASRVPRAWLVPLGSRRSVGRHL